jgi:hypothetical protein
MSNGELSRPVDRAALARAREARDRVIARLSDEFAHDVLGVEEFERRVTLAQTSESVEEIEALLRDLPDGPGQSRAPAPVTPRVAPAPGPSVSLAPMEPYGERQTLLAILGGIGRNGRWLVPRRFRVVAMMGGAHLDLREAIFPPGPVELEVIAFMGGVEIVVPPGLAVQTSGTGIMGGFQQINRAPAHPDPDAPLLRIHGFAVMGGVDVKMRLPGESDREARRRLRNERREERRAERALDRADRHERRHGSD